MIRSWFSQCFFHFSSEGVKCIGIYVHNRGHSGIFHIIDFNTVNKKIVRKSCQSLGKYFSKRSGSYALWQMRFRVQRYDYYVERKLLLCKRIVNVSANQIRVYTNSTSGFDSSDNATLPRFLRTTREKREIS